MQAWGFGSFVGAALVATVLSTTGSGAAFAAEKGIGATSGMASYYGYRGRTANGEHHDARALTAAHRTLPFGTRVRVTNASNGRTVVVRINDRGPFIKGRVIDVSTAAAEVLGFRSRGVAKVQLAILN